MGFKLNIPRRNPPCRKVSYDRKQDAEAAMAAIRTFALHAGGPDPDGHLLNVYWCVDCESYHVGHDRRRSTS